MGTFFICWMLAGVVGTVLALSGERFKGNPIAVGDLIASVVVCFFGPLVLLFGVANFFEGLNNNEQWVAFKRLVKGIMDKQVF